MLLKQIEFILSLCPYRLAISVVVSMFQSLIVLSDDPLARITPLLLKQTEVMLFLCPYKLPITVFVSIFHT